MRYQIIPFFPHTALKHAAVRTPCDALCSALVSGPFKAASLGSAFSRPAEFSEYFDRGRFYLSPAKIKFHAANLPRAPISCAVEKKEEQRMNAWKRDAESAS